MRAMKIRSANDVRTGDYVYVRGAWRYVRYVQIGPTMVDGGGPPVLVDRGKVAIHLDGGKPVLADALRPVTVR